MVENCPNCGTGLKKDDTRCENCLKLIEPRLHSDLIRYYNRSSVSDPDDEVYRNKDTFREKVKMLFPRIEQRAANGEVTNQANLWGDGIDVWAMKHYLGAVSAVEYWDGRPLLTSIVVNEEQGYPGDGYFNLVERLDGLPEDITTWSIQERKEWWRRELEQVHDWWREFY